MQDDDKDLTVKGASALLNPQKDLYLLCTCVRCMYVYIGRDLKSPFFLMQKTEGSKTGKWYIFSIFQPTQNHW